MAILIAEPDEAEAQRMLQGLRLEGFTCDRVESGQLALARAGASEALIAEVALPVLPGLELAKRLRKDGITTPLLFISSLCTPEHRVAGLEAGADDYLCKPFALAELSARLKALIRRSRMPARPLRLLLGDLIWEPDRRQVYRAGERLDLTPKEYLILALLLERVGQVVSREAIAQTLWGAGKERPDLRSPNAMDAQVRRLRAKVDGPFGQPLLHTLRGQGLMIEVR